MRNRGTGLEEKNPLFDLPDFMPLPQEGFPGQQAVRDFRSQAWHGFPSALVRSYQSLISYIPSTEAKADEKKDQEGRMVRISPFVEKVVDLINTTDMSLFEVVSKMSVEEEQKNKQEGLAKARSLAGKAPSVEEEWRQIAGARQQRRQESPGSQDPDKQYSEQQSAEFQDAQRRSAASAELAAHFGSLSITEGAGGEPRKETPETIVQRTFNALHALTVLFRSEDEDYVKDLRKEVLIEIATKRNFFLAAMLPEIARIDERAKSNLFDAINFPVEQGKNKGKSCIGEVRAEAPDVLKFFIEAGGNPGINPSFEVEGWHTFKCKGSESLSQAAGSDSISVLKDGKAPYLVASVLQDPSAVRDPSANASDIEQKAITAILVEEIQKIAREADPHKKQEIERYFKESCDRAMIAAAMEIKLHFDHKTKEIKERTVKNGPNSGQPTRIVGYVFSSVAAILLNSDYEPSKKVIESIKQILPGEVMYDGEAEERSAKFIGHIEKCVRTRGGQGAARGASSTEVVFGAASSSTKKDSDESHFIGGSDAPTISQDSRLGDRGLTAAALSESLQNSGEPSSDVKKRPASPSDERMTAARLSESSNAPSSARGRGDSVIR